MEYDDLIYCKDQLKKAADILYKEIEGSKDQIVSRYVVEVTDYACFEEGKRVNSTRDFLSTLNKENITKKKYSVCEGKLLNPRTFKEICLERDLNEDSHTFSLKGIPLPTDQKLFFENIPSNADYFDKEFLAFTEKYSSSIIKRELVIRQEIIVNSQGGVFIQSVPYFTIKYTQGHDPLIMTRYTGAVCTTDEELKNMTSLIKLTSDPYPDKRIRNSKTFTESFGHINTLSKLKYKSFHEAGIKHSRIHDVVVMGGSSIHEIFGHQFEEPIEGISSGEIGTFVNVNKLIEGYRSYGFSHFDSYGRNRDERIHIKNGLVREYLGSEYVDKEKLIEYLEIVDSKSVGNARQDIKGSFPDTRMSCTVLDGKIKNTDLEGKIIVNSNSGHTSTDDKTYMINADEAYVIRNGEPLRIIPLKMSGAINAAIKNLILLEDFTYMIGMCGKGDPLGYGHAYVPVCELVRNQIWRQQQVYPIPIKDKDAEFLKTLK
jgi:hypothetical protein